MTGTKETTALARMLLFGGRQSFLVWAVFVAMLFAAAVGQGRSSGAYAELKRDIREGKEIAVDFDTKEIRIERGAKRGKHRRGAEAREWVKSIARSPGLEDELKHYSPEQKVILESYGAMEKIVQTDEAHGDAVRFYVLHLLSPDPEMSDIAFRQLLKKKSKHNDFEPYLDAEARSALVESVRKNPLRGMRDKQALGFKNVVAMIGMSGRTEQSIELLESLEKLVPGFEFSRKVALARLDPARADEFIERYRHETNLREKGELALALGQISIDATLRLLAQDLRSDVRDPHGMGFNQYALGGLCFARDWPEGAARFEVVGGFDQAAFDAAEAWVVERLGTTWEVPKPPVRKLERVSF